MMTAYICESEFDTPDSKNPDYSFVEIDYYMWTAENNHRLSLRKNLRAGIYEVYRHSYRDKRDEVLYSGDLGGALKFAGEETRKNADKDFVDDLVCTHVYPHKATFCGYKRNE